MMLDYQQSLEAAIQHGNMQKRINLDWITISHAETKRQDYDSIYPMIIHFFWKSTFL